MKALVKDRNCLTPSKSNLAREIAELEQMTVSVLQARYLEVFNEPVRSRHKQYLIRRIAWRLQANAEGGLSDRALRRVEELANNSDVRVTPPRVGAPARQVADRAGSVRVLLPPSAQAIAPRNATTDSRLPQVGTQITRKYKGRTLVVTVLADGFEYLGERYRSLTAVAKVVTGAHMSGFRFFGIGGQA